MDCVDLWMSMVDFIRANEFFDEETDSSFDCIKHVTDQRYDSTPLFEQFSDLYTKSINDLNRDLELYKVEVREMMEDCLKFDFPNLERRNEESLDDELHFNDQFDASHDETENEDLDLYQDNSQCFGYLPMKIKYKARVRIPIAKRTHEPIYQYTCARMKFSSPTVENCKLNIYDDNVLEIVAPQDHVSVIRLVDVTFFIGRNDGIEIFTNHRKSFYLIMDASELISVLPPHLKLTFDSVVEKWRNWQIDTLTFSILMNFLNGSTFHNHLKLPQIPDIMNIIELYTGNPEIAYQKRKGVMLSHAISTFRRDPYNYSKSTVKYSSKQKWSSSFHTNGTVVFVDKFNSDAKTISGVDVPFCNNYHLLSVIDQGVVYTPDGFNIFMNHRGVTRRIAHSHRRIVSLCASLTSTLCSYSTADAHLVIFSLMSGTNIADHAISCGVVHTVQILDAAASVLAFTDDDVIIYDFMGLELKHVRLQSRFCFEVVSIEGVEFMFIQDSGGEVIYFEGIYPERTRRLCKLDEPLVWVEYNGIINLFNSAGKLVVENGPLFIM